MDHNRNERLKDIIHTGFATIAMFITILVFIEVGQNQVEGDTLWHIKAGQWVCENGIPFTDPFSWTMRGENWFAHEWLWEVCAALIYRSFGHTGIWFFTCIPVAVYCAVSWLLLRRRCILPIAALLYIILIVSSCVFWNARPHSMAQALFAFTIFIVLSCRDKPGLLVILPVIILLWANMHGSAPLGVIVVVFFALLSAKGINLHLSALHTEKLSKKLSLLLGLAAIASFIASLINPRGINLWTYMWNVSHHRLLTDYILEWQSPNFHNNVFWPIIIFSICLFSLPAIKLTSTERKIPLYEFLLTCGFFFLALQQVRHAPYFYFTSILVIGNIIGAQPCRSRPFRQLKLGIIVIVITAFATLISYREPTWISEGTFFPVAATDYLLNNKLVNNVFNDYSYGGYLIWQGISPFIDGRADLYTFNSDVFYDYFGITAGATIRNSLNLEPSPKPYLDKYNVHVIIIGSGSSLDLYLTNHPAWKESFRDKLTVVYQRKHLRTD